VADREPIGANDRRTGDMTEPRPAQGVAHAGHDLFVIAAAADRDADAPTRAAADAQMRDCTECAAVFADLRAISTGLATMPRELAAPTDYRLTPERAASLRRGGLRRLLYGLRLGPSLRPLGTALATIGFAGLFVTVAMPAIFGGSSAAILSTVGSSVPAFAVQGGGGAAPTELRTNTDSRSGSIPPADQGAGSTGGPAAVAASAAPASSQYGAVVNPGTPQSTDTAGEAPELAQSAPLDPVAVAAWLSLGAFVVGLGLLGLARLGARART